MTNSHIAEYIGHMATELAQLCRANGMERLNFICQLAADEAAWLKTGQPRRKENVRFVVLAADSSGEHPH